jgi:HSP20 family protein
MAIQRWEPFREMVSLRDAMNSLLQESFVRPTGLLGDGAGAALPLPLDISENENEFIVKASLPGVRPEDVQITVHGDTLTIRGETKAEEEKNDENFHLRERRYGMFVRTVTLSTPISPDKAQAQFENGVLTLRLPKAEEAKPKLIRVAPKSVGGSNGGASNAGGASAGGSSAGASSAGGANAGGASSAGGANAGGASSAGGANAGGASSAGGASTGGANAGAATAGAGAGGKTSK